MNKKIKRLCILLDEPKLMKCYALALEKAVKENDLLIPLVIIRERKSFKLKFDSISKEIIKYLIIYTRKILRTESNLFKKVPISNLSIFTNSEIIYSPALRSGKYRTVLPQNTIQTIVDKKIDLLIRRGFGILKGEILECVPFGVLSYHNGSLVHYRGSMGCVTSYINDEPVIYLSVQKLNESLDGGDLIAEFPIYIKNAKSYKEVINLIGLETINSLTKTIKLMNLSDYKIIRYSYDGNDYHFPTLKEFCPMLIKYIKIGIKRKIRQNFFIKKVIN
jgi:folate-dependent phosphoribosylglycinamide formyltransferase PurN